MYKTINANTLEALTKIDTPSICNAIEGFDVRPRTEGFMSADIRSQLPSLPAVAGYAVTAMISAKSPHGPQASRDDWWDFIMSVPAPRFVGIQDIDDPAFGAYWGENNSNIHKALGCVGVATNGTVRDLDEVRPLGFQLFSPNVAPSHGYVHLVDVGKPVTVGGLTVHPGDLMHGDKHGVTSIPFEIADELPAMVKTIADYEALNIELCQSDNFSLEKLKELAKATRPY